jgi:hypothetical protein
VLPQVGSVVVAALTEAMREDRIVWSMRQTLHWRTCATRLDHKKPSNRSAPEKMTSSVENFAICAAKFEKERLPDRMNQRNLSECRH